MAPSVPVAEPAQLPVEFGILQIIRSPGAIAVDLWGVLGEPALESRDKNLQSAAGGDRLHFRGVAREVEPLVASIRHPMKELFGGSRQRSKVTLTSTVSSPSLSLADNERNGRGVDRQQR